MNSAASVPRRYVRWRPLDKRKVHSTATGARCTAFEPNTDRPSTRSSALQEASAAGFGAPSAGVVWDTADARKGHPTRGTWPSTGLAARGRREGNSLPFKQARIEKIWERSGGTSLSSDGVIRIEQGPPQHGTGYGQQPVGHGAPAGLRPARPDAGSEGGRTPSADAARSIPAPSIRPGLGCPDDRFGSVHPIAGNRSRGHDRPVHAPLLQGTIPDIAAGERFLTAPGGVQWRPPPFNESALPPRLGCGALSAITDLALDAL